MRVKITINQAVWERTTGYADIPDDIDEDDWEDWVQSDDTFWDNATHQVGDTILGFDTEYTFERSK